MATPDRQVISISSEEEAWSALEFLLKGKLKAEQIQLRFDNASWAEVRLKLTGDVFDQTVTPPIAKGLVDFQSSFYRAVAQLTKGEADARRLTDAEKTSFELVFKVDSGSSELWAVLEGALRDVGGKIIDKMDKKTILILFLGLALIYGGHSMGSIYLNNIHEEKLAETAAKAESERARVASEGETARAKINADKDSSVISALAKVVDNRPAVVEKQKILNEAARSDPAFSTVLNEGLGAYDSIVRQCVRANHVEIQGKRIDNNVIQAVRKASRRNSSTVRLKENFYIKSIDRLAPGSFQYGLESVENERMVYATLEDPVLLEKYGRILRERLGDGKPIRVEVTAKQIGDDLVEAEITKASTARKISKS